MVLNSNSITLPPLFHLLEKEIGELFQQLEECSKYMATQYGRQIAYNILSMLCQLIILFSEDNGRRLEATKAVTNKNKYDPDNLFRLNQNIKPAR